MIDQRMSIGIIPYNLTIGHSAIWLPFFLVSALLLFKQLMLNASQPILVFCFQIAFSSFGVLFTKRSTRIAVGPAIFLSSLVLVQRVLFPLFHLNSLIRFTARICPIHTIKWK